MKELKRKLKNRLTNAKKIAVLGIGSQLKGDDASGIVAAMHLKELVAESDKNADVEIFIGGTAPENITGEIRKFEPSDLIIIDSADIGGSPGDIKLIDVEEMGGISFSTHNLPASMLIAYLMQFLKCNVFIIGIQPKSLDFGAELSPEVEKASKLLAELIADACL